MDSAFNCIENRIVNIIYIVIVLLLVVVSASGQSDCRTKTENYIKRLKDALQNFTDDPGIDAQRDRYLESLRKNNPKAYNLVERLSKEANVNMQQDSLWLQCFQQEFLNVSPTEEDENIIRWSAHLFKRFVAFDFVSPEFETGFGIHVDVNQGAADLGQKSEAYSFAARVLLAYTFSKELTGGRFRILGGVSTYYFDNKFSWFANPRLEYRIRDIGNDLTTFGNWKAIVDANFGKTWIAGVGIGLELHNFGAQLIYQRQGDIKDSHLLVGVFYRFLK
jgi:hypothetical protein